MEYLPIFLNGSGRVGLVVGGGEVAARKVELLRRAGMTVRVVAPRLCRALEQALAAGEIEHHCQAFQPGAVDGAAVAIAATDDRAVNAGVAEAARARNIPVNVVDDPELSTFIVPAVIDRSPLVIALSTAGKAPVLARLLRSKLEAFVPAAYGHLAALMGRFRETVKERIPHEGRRLRFWEEVLDGPIGDQAVRGDAGAAEASLSRALDHAEVPSLRGEVSLVGAGPGDPDLLTIKALRVMQRADVVVYDRLVSGALLDRVRRDAERVFVGKATDRHTIPQQEINELLTRLAREGRRVVRLKGGDPFVFGRGGEEIAHLKEAGVPFRVVPGITAALGCSTYSGIPLTHRDHAHATVFVTGHLKDGTLDLPWTTLLQPGQTVVVYMGLKGLPQLRDGLLERGLPADTPAAVVEQGTTVAQRVITGTLETLPEKAAAARMQPPTLVLIGEVVRLRQSLKWFREPETGIEGGQDSPAFEVSV